MKASLRGTEIFYDVAGMQVAPQGEGFVERPVLFLLHGGPGGSHLRYKQHSLELQDAAQLIMIDHRGCGRSKKTRIEDYTLENNIEDIEALRQQLGLEKICVLGTSYGGMVAQGYATRYIQHVEKLILVATAPSYRFLERAKAVLQQRGTPEQIQICEYLWNGNFKDAHHVDEFFQIMDSLYSRVAKVKKKPVYGNDKGANSAEALNYGFGGFLRSFDFIPDLHKITCPTLILAGEDDWICTPDQAKTIAEHIPHAELKTFKDCGHAVAVDMHDTYIKLIQDFLRQPQADKNS